MIAIYLAPLYLLLNVYFLFRILKWLETCHVYFKKKWIKAVLAMIYVFLANGFEEIEGLTVVDLLRRAKIYVDTVSIMDDYIVHGAHGINVQTEDLFDEVDFEEFDMVVLPGGMPGTLNLKEHDGVRYVVKQYAKEGRFVGAICAAPTILKSLGLLEGRRATCYPGVEDEMENVILTETAVVVDDNIITSQGVGTAIDFALKLIEVLDGEEKAKEIAESIVF